MKILVSDNDDFLYERLLALLEEIKLVQGGTALSSSLRRHSKIKLYLIEKQIEKIRDIEEKYFTDSGLDQMAITSHHVKQKSLQNLNNNVHLK